MTRIASIGPFYTLQRKRLSSVMLTNERTVALAFCERHPRHGRIEPPSGLRSTAGRSPVAPRRSFALRTTTRFLLCMVLIATTACKQQGQTESTATPTPGSAAAAASPEVIVAARAHAPAPAAPRLAQVAVFPEVDRPLRVVTTQPADGAEGIAVDAETGSVVVRFNHPVVALAEPSEAESSNASSVASLSPPVAGKARWLDTSTWIFEPSEPLRGSTRYEVTLDETLADMFGATLEEATRFGFSTEGPAIRRTAPVDMARFVAPTAAVSITFNQAVDEDSTISALSVRDRDGADVAGTRSLSADGTTLLFRPDDDWVRGARYVAKLEPGALARDGEAAIQTTRSIRFTIAPMPELVSSAPADGAKAVSLGYGGLELTFNTPMDTSAVSVTLVPTITQRNDYWEEDDKVLRIYGEWNASTSYTATVPADARSALGDRLGSERTVAFSLAPMEPRYSMETGGPFGVQSAFKPPRIWFSAVNTPKVGVRLYTLTREELLRVTTDGNVWDFRPTAAKRIRTWDIDTSGGLNQWRTVSTTLAADGRLLAPGAYLVDASNADDNQKTVLLVSPWNLTLKATSDEVLVWVTDLATGEPVPDAAIAVYEQGDRVLAEGRTRSDGMIRAPIVRKGDPWDPIAAVSERDGQVVAAVGRNWNSGIGPWEFGLPYTVLQPGFSASLYTDRPLYRAGQRVYVRGILRRDEDLTLSVPDRSQHEIQLIVSDPNYEVVHEAIAELSDFGTFHGELALSPQAPLGDYRVEARWARRTQPEIVRGDGDGVEDGDGDGDEVEDEEVRTQEGSEQAPEVQEAPDADADANAFTFESSFRVAAYRKPAYEVSVAVEPERVVEGEDIEVVVDAQYFFGGPVVGAGATWRIMADDYLFAPDVPGRWEFVDYDLRQEYARNPSLSVLAEGEGETDAEGRLRIRMPADLAGSALSKLLTFDVELMDADHQAVAGRTSIIVDKADLYLGLRPERYVAEAGEPAVVELLALQADGEPAADRTVTIVASQREWFSVKEKREDGRFYWTSHFTDTQVAEQIVRTDTLGRASTTWTPVAGGVHRLEARGSDENGRSARSAAYQWVTLRGGPFINWRQENNDRIDLVADARSYRPGDTARILVPAPFYGATALLTVERGSIREARVLHLPTNSETIDIPITEDMAPNAFVSVVLMRGVSEEATHPQFKVGYTNLEVALEGKLIDLRVTPDRSAYGPRDTVRWNLEARDAQDQPVQAEFSVALVDRALLALAVEASPPLVDAFYGQRALGVETAASLTESLDRIDQQLVAEAKGGGGGLGAEPGGVVRRLFQDMAFWNPAVVTDDAGRATVDTPLPDNLTTWRLDARGITADTSLVGSATADVIATRPLLLQPVLPRFVVVGDNLQLEAIVRNGTDAERQVEVSLRTVGMEVLDEPTHRVRVPALGAAIVVWQASVPLAGTDLSGPVLADALGEVVVNMSVRELAEDEDEDEDEGEDGDEGELGPHDENEAPQGADLLADAVEIRLPAYGFLAPHTVATAGVVFDRETEQIEIPDREQAQHPELEVELSPSLAAASLGGLDYLEAFPYDCTEQTVSKFVPNLASLIALQRLDVDRPVLEAQLRAAVQAHVLKLYGYQLEAGGWGWFGESATINPWLTGYALLGLSLAEEAGIEVRPDVLERAESSLQAYVNRSADGSPHLADRQAFAVWVLAHRGRLAPSRAVRLWERRTELGLDGKAFLAMALADSGPDSAARVAALIADLSGAAKSSATGASWHEGQLDRYAMASDTRTTAIVLYSLARLDPEHPSIDPGVRWLMSARSAAHWETTQETAWAILALSEVMATSGELDTAYDFVAELDGIAMGQGSVNASSLGESVTFNESERLVAGAMMPLQLIKRGSGRMYYTARLRTFPTARDAPPVDEGIVLGRTYHALRDGNSEADGPAIDTVDVGELVQVRLVLIADRPLHYVKLFDALPAGFEAVDTSLKTTSAAALGPELRDMERDEQNWWHRGWWSHWTRTEIRDDGVVLFADFLPAGSYEYRYSARATLVGDFHVRPALAEQMYAPEVFGRSAGGVFEVKR